MESLQTEPLGMESYHGQFCYVPQYLQIKREVSSFAWEQYTWNVDNINSLINIRNFANINNLIT